MNSGDASLQPPLPLLPVYLLKTTPLPKKQEFLTSLTCGKSGSNPAETSEESIFEAVSTFLNEQAFNPVELIKSMMQFSKNLDWAPVAPILPTSSLSTKIQQEV